MKTTEPTIPKALREVWEWKDEVYEETKDLTCIERKACYKEGLENAARILDARIVRNLDGTYSLH